MINSRTFFVCASREAGVLFKVRTTPQIHSSRHCSIVSLILNARRNYAGGRLIRSRDGSNTNDKGFRGEIENVNCFIILSVKKNKFGKTKTNSITSNSTSRLSLFNRAALVIVQVECE